MPRRTTRAALLAAPLAAFALLGPDAPEQAPRTAALPAPTAEPSPGPARLPDGERPGAKAPEQAAVGEQPAPEQAAPARAASQPGTAGESASDRVLRNAMNPVPAPAPTASIAPELQAEIDRLNNQPPIELGTITPPPPEPFNPEAPEATGTPVTPGTP